MIHTEEMEEIDFEMSNFDYVVDDGFEEALRANPNGVFGRHNARNFNGHVWFDGSVFCEQVWRYSVPGNVLKAETLKELMEIVNDEYGYK